MVRAKFIYESLQFQRSSDPRQVLNIGQRVQIEEWFRDIERQKGYNMDYTIDDNLNVAVNCNLWIRGLNITWVPNNLSVEGDLDLSYTKISKLSNNLSVKGSLDLSYTNITKLPDNLTVNGYINLTNTKITELPDSLSVRGNIWISKDMKNTLVVPEQLRSKIKIT